MKKIFDGLVFFGYQFFLAVDQVINVLLLGYADETLSSRAYRADEDGRLFGKFLRPVIDLMFFWQKHHCYNAYLNEINRKHFATKMLQYQSKK